jgi:hypothetical protein
MITAAMDDGGSVPVHRCPRNARQHDSLKQVPATIPSNRRRFGARFRERLRISRRCLTSRDSALQNEHRRDALVEQ